MTDETKTTNTEAPAQEQPNADPAGTGEPAAQGKTFTQEEVNRIVSDRLARERAKAEAPAADERVAELATREEQLKCRELIADESSIYPAALLKVLDASDFEQFKKTADALLEAFPKIKQTPRNFRNPPAPAYGAPPKSVDPIAQVFKAR